MRTGSILILMNLIRMTSKSNQISIDDEEIEVDSESVEVEVENKIIASVEVETEEVEESVQSGRAAVHLVEKSVRLKLR